MDTSGELKGSLETTSTDGPDVFKATDLTLTAGDRLDGGAGSDKLTIVSAGGTLGQDAKVGGIEQVSIEGQGVTNLVMTNFTGVTSVVSDGSTAGVTFSDVQAIPAVTVKGTSAGVTVSAAAAVVAGLADSVSLNLDTVATKADNTVTLNGIETVNIIASGAVGSSINGVTTATTIASNELESVTVAGSANVRLVANMAGADLVTQVGKFDASAATGSVTATVTAGDSGKLSVTGGAGNDVLTVNAITKDMTVAGGAGNDTLVAWDNSTYAATTAVQSGANVTGFEVASAGGAGNTVDQRMFAGNTFTGSLDAGKYTNLSASFATATINNSGDVTIDRATATDTAADALAVSLSGLASITSTITAAEEEKITINTGAALSVTGGAVSHAITLAGAEDLTDLIVTGANSVNLGALGGAVAVKSIDASGHTGAAFTVDATASEVGVTIKGSAGLPATEAVTVNTITGGTKADSITGGAYKDVLNGGAGNDTIDGGAGNDTINGGTGNDSILGGAGNDIIGGDSGNDYIDGGDGDDQINAGLGTDTVIGGAGNDWIAVTLSDSTSVDGGAGTDRVAATSGSLLTTSASAVNGAFINIAEDVAPKLTSVESLYASVTGAATGAGLDLTAASSLTSLFLETAAVATKVTNFAGSAVRLYGATTDAVEATTLLLDGVGQSALTVGLEAYSGATALTVSGVAGLTIEGRSTSQFTGSADQANAINTVTASAAASVTIRSTGSAAANATALAVGDVTATNATAITLSAGAKDTVTVAKVDAGALVETLSVTVGADAALGVASGLNLTAAALTTATVDVGVAGILTTTGAAGGAAVDLNASKISTLTVSLADSATAKLDLTAIEVTKGTFSVDTASTLTLVNSLGAATKASSFTFTGRGDVDPSAAAITLVGSSVSFDSTGLTVDADGFNLTGTAGADTIRTNLGADTIVGGTGNDTISSGEGADTITGGAGDDTITLTETVSAADKVVFAATAATNGVDTITGFNKANDTLNWVTAGAEVAVTGALTTTANNLYQLGSQAAGSADSLSAAAAAINAAATWTHAGATVSWIAVSDDNSTSIYEWSDAATAGVQAGELTLVATVSTAMTTGELGLAFTIV